MKKKILGIFFKNLIEFNNPMNAHVNSILAASNQTEKINQNQLQKSFLL